MAMNAHSNQENPELEILLISSSKPDGKLAGSILFRRHFNLFSKKIQLTVLPADIREIFPVKQSRIIKRIRKTRFAKYLDEFFWILHTHLPIHLLLKKPRTAMVGCCRSLS